MRRWLPLLLLAGCSGGPSGAPGPYAFLGMNPQGFAEYVRARDGMTVVLVPAGPYPRRPYEKSTMTEEPEEIQIPAFLMDKHEVSNAQFARFLNARAVEADPSEVLVRERPWGLRRTASGWAPQPGMEDYPAVGVTGWGAQAYARWAGAELPSADAWMKAAGGPEGLEYPFGGWREDACNWRHSGLRRTAPVSAFPGSASPYGCLNMSGNVYERVRIPRGPIMVKGGSWSTNHLLNLRVLDLCIQPMEAAEQSVGFRCMAWAQALPPADSRKSPPTPPAALPPPEPLPELRIAPSLVEGLLEARERNCVLFLSLHHETCGQCDRTREQVLYDPDLSAFLNASCVVVQGQDPWDALDRPHAPRADGQCPLFPALRCAEHEKAFVDGLNLVRRFRTSPGYFALSGGADPEILLGEDVFPKSGDDAPGFRARLQEAQARLGPFLNREDADAIRDAMASGDREALRARLDGKDPRIPLVSDARALLDPPPGG